jgi:hypothetical protein
LRWSPYHFIPYISSFLQAGLKFPHQQQSSDRQLFVRVTNIDVIKNLTLIAALNGHEPKIKYLLSLDNIKTNWVDDKGRTLLYLAAEGGYDDVVYHIL